MSESPITPAEGTLPPKITPVKPSASPKLSATVRIQPIDAIPVAPVKPVIQKPTPAAAAATTPAAAIEAAKKLTGSLKAVTGAIAAEAVLRKTGIIAEGVPTDVQAAKTKTSRISLNDAMGVAPTKEAPAPLKTIRLKRPTGLPAQPASAVPAPAAPAASAAEPAASVTQKKTLKLHRPSNIGAKRPTLGIKKPDAPAAAPEAAAAEPAAEGAPVEAGTFAPAPAFQPAASKSSGVPKWLLTLSVLSSLAALIVFGVATFFMVIEGMSTEAADLGANSIGFIQTVEDHHIDMR